MLMPLQQVRIALLNGSWQTGSGFGIDRLQTHQAQQPPHAFAIDRIALRVQPGGHLACAVKRRARVLLIQAAASAANFPRFLAPAHSSNSSGPDPAVHIVAQCSTPDALAQSALV